MSTRTVSIPSFEDLDPRVGKWLAALLLYEVVASYLYFRYTPADLSRLRYLVYPFVWINVGLVTCVSCAAPLLTSGVALLGGGAGAVAMATRYSVDLGTLAFLVSVALLYRGATGDWLPTTEVGGR